MNTQTERLDNHTARLTVQVEPERLEKAMHTAAQKLSRQLNIPGFRKGKAPYRVVVNYVGQGAVLEDAVEVLGNEVYKQVLDEADIEPYGPGQLEDVKVEDTPTFTFVVPLQPTVDLNDYRSMRIDYTPPEVSDKQVNDSLRSLQEQEAVVEESQRPAALGDRITAYIDARLVTDETDEASETVETEIEAEAETGDVEIADEAADEADHDEDHDHDHDRGDEHHHHVDENTIVHEHDATLSLAEDAEPLPGFAKAMEGATVGERREFELTYPDDEEYGELAGKRAKFDVTVKKIENVTLPALNDDLAARVTKDEETPLSLLELRMRVRENIQRSESARYDQDYGRQALDKMVEEADIQYPEAIVAEQVQSFLRNLDRDLRQRGITLEDYKKIYNRTDDDLYNDYRDGAVLSVERGLVMREIIDAEMLAVSPEEVEAEIERLSAQFGERAADYRRLFREKLMRDNLRSDLLNRKVMDRVVEIAKGQAPDLGVNLAESPGSAEVVEPSAEASEAAADTTTETINAEPASEAVSEEAAEE